MHVYMTRLNKFGWEGVESSGVARVISAHGDIDLRVITGTDGGLDVTVDTPLLNVDFEFLGHDETGEVK